jgi:biotin carboxyl carrier protein
MSTMLHIDGQEVVLDNVQRKGATLTITYKGVPYHFRAERLPDGTQLLAQEIAEGVWQRTPGHVWQSGKDTKRVQLGALEAKVTTGAKAEAGQGASALSPLAPMPGLVRQILVAVGDVVKSGQPVAVMEAMKLQMTLSAGGDGTVEAVLVKEGDMIPEGTELVRMVAKNA